MFVIIYLFSSLCSQCIYSISCLTSVCWLWFNYIRAGFTAHFVTVSELAFSQQSLNLKKKINKSCTKCLVVILKHRRYV